MVFFYSGYTLLFSEHLKLLKKWILFFFSFDLCAHRLYDEYNEPNGTICCRYSTLIEFKLYFDDDFPFQLNCPIGNLLIYFIQIAYSMICDAILN